MPGINVESDGTIVVSLQDYEASLLRRLCGEMRLLLEADLPRADPVTARLFPRAYEDEDDQSNYEELLGGELRNYKLAALREVEGALGDGAGMTAVILRGELRDQWLTFLTDTRLALGTRLEVTEEMLEEEPDPESPEGVSLAVMHWVGWVQERILEAMMTTEGEP